MSKDFKTEAEKIFFRWLEKTIRVLKQEAERLGVKDTEALLDSLRYQVITTAAGRLGAEIFFLTRGRFVDMGAGRRAKAARLTKRKQLKKRKAKRWYSPAFYARLNDLQGALGISLTEQCIDLVKTAYSTP